MNGWPPFCSPGWVAAYAAGAVLWILFFGVTPLPVIIAVDALGLLGITWLGSKFDSGEFPPPEDR